MNIILELSKIIIPAIVGGGGTLFFIRLKHRSESAKVTGEEYSVLELIVRNSSKQTSELLKELQEMARQQAELISDVNQVKENYHRLRVLVKQVLNEYTGSETDAIKALREEVK